MAHRLTLAFPDYARLMPLALGDVSVPGLDVTWVRGPRHEVLTRVLGDATLDGGEHSLAQHLYRTAAGDKRFVAVPVFPLRNFAARDLFVRKGSGLMRLADLKGKRIGMYSWTASGSVWYRHTLRHAGVEARDVHWTIGPIDEPAPATLPTLPPGITAAPAGDSLAGMLAAGKLDAIYSPLRPPGYHVTDGPLVRLVADLRAVEGAYFRETGCFPPQHVVILRRESYERAPEVLRLLQVFLEEGERLFVENQRLFPYASPFIDAEIDEVDQLMGADHHAHGFAKNRHALEVFCREAHRLGLVNRVVKPEEMFGEFLGAI